MFVSPRYSVNPNSFREQILRIVPVEVLTSAYLRIALGRLGDTREPPGRFRSCWNAHPIVTPTEPRIHTCTAPRVSPEFMRTCRQSLDRATLSLTCLFPHPTVIGHRFHTEPSLFCCSLLPRDHRKRTRTHPGDTVSPTSGTQINSTATSRLLDIAPRMILTRSRFQSD
jgi:hypothetical protein